MPVAPLYACVCTWHAIVQMEVRTVLWTAEAAVCESILRVEAACGVTWTLLKGGKGPFLGAIRNQTIDSTDPTDAFGRMSSIPVGERGRKKMKKNFLPY